MASLDCNNGRFVVSAGRRGSSRRQRALETGNSLLSIISIALIFGSALTAKATIPPLQRHQLPSFRSPHAVFVMDDPYNYGTNPAIGGLRKQIRWTDLQPDNGDVTQIDWSYFDGLVNDANNTYGKQIEFSLLLLGDPPEWLQQTPGVHTYSYESKTGKGDTIMVLPWETPVQTALVNLIAAICDRYDGQLDGIVMGGIGFMTETYFPTPTDLTPALHLSLEKEISLWESSSEVLIDTYAAHLQQTAFILAVGIPFLGAEGSYTDGSAAITEVVNHGLLYPHFGVMNWGLNAKSALGYLPWDFVYDYSPTQPAGLQVSGSTTGNGGDLHGPLSKALYAGIALRMQWVEIYAADANDSRNTLLLTTIASLLYPPPQ